MGDELTQRCDVCGVAKKDTNHWFRALIEPGHYFYIRAWDEARNDSDKYICGEACAQKALSRAIGAICQT